MQAYASAESLPRTGRTSQPRPVDVALASTNDASLIDQLLGQLADLVAERLLEHASEVATDQSVQWLDARGAADYLGVHPDTVRKLAASRALPAHQDGPRCKLYFRRTELDDWRLAGKAARGRMPHLRSVS